MIFQAMELIRVKLNEALGTALIPEPVILGNIAFATPDNPGTMAVDESAQVYMSLVNVEEESSLRNLSAVRQNEIRPLAYVNPPMHLNLFLLFTANHKDYSMALRTLGQILFFFQGNKSFSISTTPVSTGVLATPTENDLKMEINLDLMSLTFEQINHLWGSLGGKQMPFLLFKARQVEIDASRMLRGGEFITQIQIN